MAVPGPKSPTGKGPTDLKRTDDEIKVEDKAGAGQGLGAAAQAMGVKVTGVDLAKASLGLASLGAGVPWDVSAGLGTAAKRARVNDHAVDLPIAGELPIIDRLSGEAGANREHIRAKGDVQISLVNRIGVSGIYLMVKDLGEGRAQIGLRKNANVTSIEVTLHRYDPDAQEIGDTINFVDNKTYTLNDPNNPILIDNALMIEYGVGAYVSVKYANGRSCQFSVVVTADRQHIRMHREDVFGEEAPIPMLAPPPEVSRVSRPSERLPVASDLMFPDHKLKSAAEAGNRIYDHLLVHLQARDHAQGLGSQIHLGLEHVFVNPESLIGIAESIVFGAYQATIPTGKSITLDLRAIGRNETLTMTPLQSGEMEAGVPVGTSEPGKRVVIRLESTQEPLGRDTVVALEGQQTMQVKRKVGGRDEVVNIVNGETVPTNVIYVVGGPYGATGEFGIYTIFAGTFSPPASDQVYWGAHAFVTGDTSFVRNDQGGFDIVPDSNLAKMVERGEVELLP